MADAAISAPAAAARENDVRSRAGLLHVDARTCRLLPRAVEQEQNVYAWHVHAARHRADDGDVSQHARRRELERALVRPDARSGVRKYHEPRSGRAPRAALAP